MCAVAVEKMKTNNCRQAIITGRCYHEGHEEHEA